MQSRKFLISKVLVLGLAIILGAGSIFAALKVKHAVVGRIERVDTAAKKVTIKTADGTMETLKYTDKTATIGAKDIAKAADFTGREGSHIIVHYSAKGADKTAEAVEFVGKDAPKIAEGTIKDIDADGRKITVMTDDGAEKTFDVSKTAVVDSGKGLADAGKFAADKTAKGAKVTVHYTDDGGRSVARFMKRF